MRQTSPITRLKPSILARSLVKEIGLNTGLALLLLLVLFTAVDLIELQSLVGSTSRSLLFAYLFKLPTTVALLLPLAVALGASVRTARLRQTGEWDAMQSAGISPITTFGRLLLVPVCLVPISVVLFLFIGPSAIARFETGVRNIRKPSPSECPSVWTKQDSGYIRFDCDNRVETIIQSNGDSRAVVRYSRLAGGDANNTKAGTLQWVIWDSQGWRIGNVDTDNYQMTVSAPVSKPAANTLWGQSLTYSQLEQAIVDAERMGVSGAALRAERALRIAAILGCPTISGAVLVLLLIFETRRAGRAVLTGIVVTVLYWAIAAFAWNGVAAGLWQDTWLSLGIPVGVSVFFGSALFGWTFLSRKGT